MPEEETSAHFVTVSPVNKAQHPMSDHLWDYVRPKVHQFIRNHSWQTIKVVGKFSRAAPYVPADSEKTYKQFNWYRPTARIVDDSTLEIACFPGRYYILHYALVIATYLALVGIKSTVVEYETNPSRDDGLQRLASGLAELGQVDTVIVGYVDRLYLFKESSYSEGQWQRPSRQEDGIFAWRTIRCENGRTITLLGCMVSFWGDISAQLIQVLRDHGMKRLFYVGKAGALRPEHLPNRWLATGSMSTVDSRVVTWPSALEQLPSSIREIQRGAHANVASPLLADKAWLSSNKDKFSWVDCEVGIMADLCIELGISYGYLHVVSDNLSDEEILGLWDERSAKISEMRSQLLRQASAALRTAARIL